MNLLSVGGSDPSSGAGIQSDIKTFDSLKVYGLTVITAITSQNTSDFRLIQPVSKKMLQSQLDSIFSDFRIDGIKIGMVYNSEIIKTLYKKCNNLKIPIILDPVIKSTTGGLLLEKLAVNDFKKFLIPLATVITPNVYEAEFLSKIKISSKISLQKASKIIQKMGAKNVVITGVKTENDRISDFVLDGKKQYMISGRKIFNVNHGSGCNYSSSVLVALTKGKSLRDAVKFSKRFTENSIKNAKKIGKGIAITQTKNEDMIHAELTQAIDKFIAIDGIYKMIPECQTNFVYAKNNPRSIQDILGISGRIVKTGKKVAIAGELEYGGSKHVATALIAMNKKFPEVKSAINIKYNHKIILKLKRNGMIISSYDRRKEPQKIKNKEGGSIMWGIRNALEESKKQPDVIYHKGDFGKEAMIMIFAKKPELVIEKILKLFN